MVYAERDAGKGVAQALHVPTEAHLLGLQVDEVAGVEDYLELFINSAADENRVCVHAAGALVVFQPQLHRTAFNLCAKVPMVNLHDEGFVVSAEDVAGVEALLQ